jgi:ADP-heptose:LPS heptosyltransferase
VEPSHPALRADFPNGAGEAMSPAGLDRRAQAAPAADPLAHARRILVLRPDNIGDVLLASPVFRALRAHRPDAALGVLASRAGAEAAALLPWVDEIVAARPSWQHLSGGSGRDAGPSAEEEHALIRRLADGRWDAALILTSWNQTAWPAAHTTYLAGIPVRAGFAGDFGGAVLTHPVPPPPRELHAAERDVALLRGIGVPVAVDQPAIVVPERARQSAVAHLRAAGIGERPFLLVAPGASAPARRPDPERLGAAARTIHDATGLAILVTGTSREAAIVGACAVAAGAGAATDTQLGLTELTAIIERAALVLCGNSAPLHIADALGRPVVAAYSGTDLASQWAPRRAPHRLLTADVACSPCYRIRCPIGNACVDLSPDAIAEAGMTLLGEPPSGGAAATSSTRSHRARRGGVACAA